MTLQVLLVEDSQDDLKALLRDLPPVFKEAGLDVQLHPTNTFEQAAELITG